MRPMARKTPRLRHRRRFVPEISVLEPRQLLAFDPKAILAMATLKGPHLAEPTRPAGSPPVPAIEALRGTTHNLAGTLPQRLTDPRPNASASVNIVKPNTSGSAQAVSPVVRPGLSWPLRSVCNRFPPRPPDLPFIPRVLSARCRSGRQAYPSPSDRPPPPLGSVERSPPPRLPVAYPAPRF